MPSDSDSLLQQLTQSIEKGVTTSNEIVKALKKIEQESGKDLSGIIHYINGAAIDFAEALKKIGDYEKTAIKQVEEDFRAKSSAKGASKVKDIKWLWKFLTHG